MSLYSRLFLALLLLSLPAAAQSAHLVADLDPGRQGLNPDSSVAFRSYTPVNGRVVFFAVQLDGDPRFAFPQCSLWATDGAAAGTERIADLCEDGETSTAGNYFPRMLAANRDLAFFVPVSGRLWRTDGTAAGTFELGFQRVGGDGGDPPVFAPDGRTLLFSGCTTGSDDSCSLWRSDGTLRGTVPVRAVGGAPTRFTPYGGRVLFASPAGIWSTDGTAQRTSRLAPAPGAAVTQIFPRGGSLYYVTFTGELWVLDPRSGRRPSRLASFDAAHGIFGVRVHEAGGRVLISVNHNDGQHSLWTTDGTPRGTRRLGAEFLSYYELVRVFDVGGRAVFHEGNLWVLPPGSRRPEPLTGCPNGCPTLEDGLETAVLFNGRLFFNGRDARRGREVWVTDGTSAGTRRLKDLCPGACDGGPVLFREVLGRLLFADHQGNLWVTDGTPAGTVRLAGLPPSITLGYQPDAAPLDGGIVFTGFDPVNGPQPWRSDLTPAGTEILAAAGTPPPASGWPVALAALGGKVLFQACAGAEDWIWASDGTAAGTIRLPATSAPCAPPRVFSRFQRAGALAYFAWNDKLWRTDGTPAGTIALLDLPPFLFPRMGELDGELVFSLPPPSFPPTSNGWIFTFWTSDGTPAGTRQVFEFRSSSGPVLFAPGGGFLLFQAQSPISPFFAELWRTDGTPAGTFPLLTLRGQVEGRVPQTAVLGGRTYFLANARSAGPELWVTDGTAAGTAPVLPDLENPGPRNLTDLVAFRGELYFAADIAQVSGGLVSGTPPHSRGLWRSDGTAAGTILLKELDLPGSLDDPRATQLTPAGDRLFFRVGDGPGRVELWKTDGTPGGTARVEEILPAPAFTNVIDLTAAGDELYFTASDGVHGNELWRSDGTSAGTFLVRDIRPGLSSSYPQALTAAEGNLFFNANDGEHGRELWAAPLPR